MTSKERMITALDGGIPDRLPVATHHVMKFFLDKYMGGASNEEFFDQFGIDPISWVLAYKPDESKGDYYDPSHTDTGFLEARRTSSDNWRIEREELTGFEYDTARYNFVTPKKTLSMILQSNEHTVWVAEHLIKEKSDIDVIGEFVTHPHCDTAAINEHSAQYGDRGLVRGHIPCFDVFGQPGTWQDASCLMGIEPLIMATFDDPEWVHALLGILFERKLTFIKSLKGANYDLLELGGGDASTTVISPQLFDDFVAPYDSKLIAAAHESGQRIAYHTCGGMMPILENIADMNPDAMETFTPAGMGGDCDLKDAKRRIGDRVCMIGGFDQFHFFTGITPEKTRQEVRRCFEEAGTNGGYIIAPSDHFFEADLDCVMAFADEARKCVY